ncbi:DnaB-like helicase N-terminal domain-containing protein [Symbiopectobacterium purcellii]|uniref:DnaB-like helicase N-terminal domain-containing protein n=1 Tax=Symbiopectobacterium purcellii TaxID=2871826 RepID=UPI003F83A778
MDSYEFEEQLVGPMMLKGDHIDCRDIAGKLPAEAFENFHLRKMYEVITALLAKAEPVDQFTVQSGVPEETKNLVLDVAKRCWSAANIIAWAKRVCQCWMLRKGKLELLRAVSLLDGAGTHDINV